MIRILLILSLTIILGACSKSEQPQLKSKIPGSYKALELFTHLRAYPNKDIPKTGYATAFKLHKEHLDAQEKNLVKTWEAMGPFNTSGRCLTANVNPQEQSTLYAGFASGGLWRSRNLGLDRSWERIETGFPVLGVSTIAFAEKDSSLMFIGTGEVYNVEETGNDGAYRATRGSYGIGILKSIDGGTTWTKSLDWTYQQNEGVWMIKVAKTNKNLVFAATTEGIMKSSDAGESWDNVFENDMVTDIEINPINPDLLVASCGNFNSNGKGIYTSSDGGTSWTLSKGVPISFLGKILLAQSQSNPSLIYASVGNGFGFNDGYTWLLKSTDGGKSFQTVNELDYSKWQGWFAHDVAINPSNDDEIITIGIDIFKSQNGGTSLTQQSNGGVTLGEINVLGPDGPPSYSHSDHHFVMYHPEVEGLVIFGNDGGIFLSFDNGETFRSANAGLQTTQFYNGFSVSDTDPNFALGGLQDNSTSIFSGSEAWTRAIGGDGSWTAINQENNLEFYGSSQYLNIAKTTNGGNSFSSARPNTNNDDVLFIAPFTISKTNPQVLYAGGEYIYKTINSADSWIRVNNGQKLNGDPVYALAISEQNEDIVYAGTAPQSQAAALFVSTNGGDSFTSVSPVSNRIVNDIEVFPNDPASAIAVYSGFGTPHVFKTENFGANWIDISNNLPDVPTNAIAIDPLDPDIFYIGNDLGVYISRNAGDSWEPHQLGLPNACIAIDLKVSNANDRLWVATHGYGTFRIPLETNTTSINILETGPKVNIYPNPSSDFVTIDLDTDEIISIELITIDLKKIKVPISENKLILSQLVPGTYFVRIKTKGGISIEKLIKI